MSKKRTNWELISLTAIIALMAGGFLWTFIAVLTAPEIRDPHADTSSDKRYRKVRDNPRRFHQEMNIHVFSASQQERALSDEERDEHEKLIPYVPESSYGMQSPMDSMVDDRANRSYMNRVKKQDEDNLLSDDEERSESGWGWLADEITKKRTEKEAKDKVDSDAEEEEDEALAQEKENERRNNKDEEKSVYFMDKSFESAADRREPLLRSVMRDDEVSGQNEESGADEYNEDEQEYADNGDDVWGRADDRKGDALAIRDPFTSDRESSSSFGNQEWGIGSDEDNFVGMNYASDNEAASGASDYNTESSAFGSDGQSRRVIEAAGSTHDNYSSQSDYFASDSMFNSGGGYTPAGVSAYSSDTMLSGSGVFGGPSVSVVTPTVNPSASLGSSSISSYRTPSSSSSIGSSRDEGAIATPKTLPW